jgi:hypothetical protein
MTQAAQATLIERVRVSHATPLGFARDSVQAGAPSADAVLLAVRHVSVTTNNITYALFGQRMRYWDFFPSGVAHWGLLPLWGFADVVAAPTDGPLSVGERVWGYWPSASHLWVQAGHVTAHGFVDVAPHRAELPSIYNAYARVAARPDLAPGGEAAQAIVRPLFLTSYLLTDYLLQEGLMGARRVLISSASSKTGYGTAWVLKHAAALGLDAVAGTQVVGLTSPGNMAFTQSLGLYDEVVAYADMAQALDAATPTVYVDFQGDAALRQRVHAHWGEALTHSAVIGATQFVHSDERPVGVAPQFFFAPDQYRRRAKQWGAEALAQRSGEALARFIAQAMGHNPPWLDIRTLHGLDGLQQAMTALAAGGVDARIGYAVQL